MKQSDYLLYVIKILFLTIIAIYFTACVDNSYEDFEAAYPCYDTNTVDDSRPDILVIGDSISMGYTPFIQDNFTTYDINHNVCNGMSSKSGVRHIDEWLAQRPQWEAITFNHTLWDAAEWVLTNNNDYEVNMRIIAKKIKAKTAQPLYITGTQVLYNTQGRYDYRVRELNAIASQVMSQEGIPVLDLHAVSATIPNLHVDPHDVHYTDDGYKILGDAVSLELFNLYGIQ